MTRRRHVVGIAVAASLAATGCGVENTASRAAPEPTALPVQTLSVEILDGYTANERYAGRIVARRSSDLGFERPGRLEEVGVDEGDRVARGDVLARLEQRVLVNRRQELVARRNEIAARLELAGLTRARRAKLAERESISPERYDESIHEERALAAQLRAANAAIAGVDVEIDLSQLRAPYDGLVTERFADEGTVVGSGQTLLRVIEDGAMEFRVGLPPEAAARLEPDARIDVETGGARHPALLDSVVGSIRPDTRTLTAVLRFETRPEDVEHGALGRIRVPSRYERPGAWLPITALTESRRGLWSAYVVVEDGSGLTAERRDLQVLHTGSARAYVRGGLERGDRVVATGVHRLVPGQRVRVVP